MTYVKTDWEDQNVENPRTYTFQDNGDGTTTIFDAFGLVTEAGTIVNALLMNKLEQGVFDNDALISALTSEYEASKDRIPTAMANVTGTGTPNVSSDYNLSTISKPSTGRYSCTFDTAMDNDEYIVLAYVMGTVANGYGYSSWIRTSQKTTTGFTVETGSLVGFENVPNLNIVVFGGKN